MNEGRIEQLDEPSRIYGFPRNRFVANFIGNINLLDAEVLAASAAELRLRVAGLGEVHAPPAAASPGQKGSFAVRPEQVRIGSHLDAPQRTNHFAGRVRDLLYIGDVTTYIVDLAEGAQFEALLPNSSPGRAKFFEVGDPVILEWHHDAGAFLRE
jgi:spermidine/putrescine transport system ATP-binding protein